MTNSLVCMWLEDWDFVDAFYFSVVSMATVGYGDLSPQSDAGKLANIPFLVIGIGVFVLSTYDTDYVLVKGANKASVNIGVIPWGTLLPMLWQLLQILLPLLKPA